MKVYEVISDVQNYQSLLPNEADIIPSGLLKINGTLLSSIWKPPHTFCLHPDLERGDFIGFVSGTIVATAEAYNKVSGFFEMAGEVLPLYYKDTEHFLLNVTEVINCLDIERSEWLTNTTGQRTLLKRYQFHPRRFVTSSLFKVPETVRGTILTFEQSRDPEEEFKAFVETENLTGLIFKMLWSDEE